MKKHLLLSMAALLGVATTASAAFEEGAIVQTPDGRSVRVTSENLLTNGDFSKGLEGWTGLTQELSEDTVKVVTDAFSPAEGVPYLQIMKTEGVKTSSLLGVASFRTSYKLEEGNTYLFTYKGNLVLGGFSSNSSGSRSDNYQHVYINGDGTCFWPTETEENKNRASVSLNTKFPVGEWFTVNYIYQCDSTEWVNFDFKNLTQFDRFADFGVYKCEEVGDARWAQEAVDALQSIIADKENFPGAAEYLQEPLDNALIPLTDPEEAAEYDPEGLLSEIDVIMGEDGPLTEYLNTISADVSGYFSENYFNYNDCAEKGYNKGAAEDWSETGGRWGVSGPWANLGTNHIFAEINADYALGAGSEYISAVLPAGKYFYMVNGSAVQFIKSGTNDYYTRRNNDMGFFINADSIPMADVPNAWAGTYWHVFDVAEAGEQTVGFWRYESAKNSGSDRERTSGGGQVRFDNMHIRILGMTDAQVEQYFLDLNKESSMATLKNLIDSANTVVTLDKYNYGKRILRDSVAIAQAVYDQNIELKATQELVDEVNARIDPMEDAIRDFYSRNELYVALATDIDEANGLYADESRKNGKDALKTAIDKAQAAYDGIQETDFTTAADSTTMIGAREALAAASEVYYFANAAYQTPAKVTIVNDDFSDGVNGWVEDGKTGNAAWKTNSAFNTADYGPDYGIIPVAYYNRGSSATDNKWVYQDVAISRTGAYDFHATLAVHNAGWSTEADTTTNNSNTFMYVNTDSLMIVTPGVGKSSQRLGQFRHFNIPIEIKNLDAVPGTTIPAGYMRIGLVKQPLADGTNVKVNMIYFGAPTLYYYGSWEDYLTGIYDVENVELNSTFDVYNLNGMKVRSGATSLDGLAKGIYIVNGKKYVVK